jgi:hypothetical protein
MIPASIHDLETRCRERGYTLEQVRGCIVSQAGDAIVVDETHPDYPRARPVPFLTKAKNFAAAAAQHLAAGAPRCTDEQIAARHDICLGCEHYQGGACTQCGCPVSRERVLISKLAWADQSCPVGKWGPV